MSQQINIIATNLAWEAGRKALGYLPEKWRNAISGKTDDATLRDFIIDNTGERGDKPIQYDDVVIATDKGGESDELALNFGHMGGSSYSYNESGELGRVSDRYYISDFNANRLATMFLRVQGSSTIMIIPCVDGSPKISMQVVHNEMPTASNNITTTNRRVKPIVFKFSFPIAYLRIYGTNSNDKETKDARSSVTKLKDKAKSTFNLYNPIGALDFKETTSYHVVRERTIPTYSQVFKELVQFPKQFGCWLYMGFGVPKISVTCSIEMQSQKNDMDCIWVEMTLVETMEFDFNKLEETYTSGLSNKQSITSSNSQGQSVSNDKKEM